MIWVLWRGACLEESNARENLGGKENALSGLTHHEVMTSARNSRASFVQQFRQLLHPKQTSVTATLLFCVVFSQRPNEDLISEPVNRAELVVFQKLFRRIHPSNFLEHLVATGVFMLIRRDVEYLTIDYDPQVVRAVMLDDF